MRIQLQSLRPHTRPGGGTTYCNRVGAELRQLGHEVNFLCPKDDSRQAADEIDGETIRAHEPLAPLRLLWRSRYYMTGQRYREVIRRHARDAELIISHSLPYAVASQYELPTTALLYFCGGIESLNYSERLRESRYRHWWKHADVKLLRHLEWKLFRHAKAVMFASPRNLELAAHWFEGCSENWIVCPQGVKDMTDEVKTDRHSVRKRWDTPSNANVLLTVSDLNPNKNTRLIVDAFAACKNPQLWLWIAGDGSEQSELQRRVQQAGLQQRVRFLGFERQMADIYAAADVFVLASKRDTFPNVYLEAMVNRLPVIGPRHDPQRGFSAVDEIMSEGISGLTFHQDNAADLAAQIDYITCHFERRFKMGNAARQKALTQFSWKRHADQILKLAQSARTNIS